MADDRRQSQHMKWLVIAAIAAYCVGTSGWGAQPEILHALIRKFEFKETAVGFLLSLELMAVAVTAFFLAPKIGGINLKRLFMYGSIIAIAGHGISAALSTIELLAISRLIAGIGEGCAIAVANTLIAASNDPQRNYGIMNAFNIAFATLFLALLAYLGQHFGAVGVFIALAIVCFLLMFPLPYISDITTGSVVSKNDGLKSSAAYSLLAAMFVWGTANASMWAFMIQFAQKTDLDPDYISLSITTWAIGGFAGSSLAAFCSTISNRVIPMIMALVLNAACAMMLTHTSIGTVYLVIAPLSVCSVYFIVPYMLGVAADIDPQGGCATAVGGMFMVTGATGPLFGGAMVQMGGFQYLGWAVVLLAAASFPLFSHAAKA